MNLGQLEDRAQDLFGFAFEGSEFRDLYNEARREFARRTKYPRKTKEIGPTVAEQAAYSFPADYLLPLSVSLGGRPLGFSDKETVERYQDGREVALQDLNVWYEKPDEDGTRKLFIFPAPGEASALLLEYVYEPADLTGDSDVPTEIPDVFHSHPLYYVAALYYRSVEDNAELAEAHERTFDQKVSEVIRYDNQRRSGNGVFRVGIAGISA